MIQNRFPDHAWSMASEASVVPSGFILVSPDVLPAPLAQAVAAQQDLYRLPYQRAIEAPEIAGRVRRWMFRAAHAAAWN